MPAHPQAIQASGLPSLLTGHRISRFPLRGLRPVLAMASQLQVQPCLSPMAMTRVRKPLTKGPPGRGPEERVGVWGGGCGGDASAEGTAGVRALVGVWSWGACERRDKVTAPRSPFSPGWASSGPRTGRSD